MQNFDGGVAVGLALRPGRAPGCPPYKSGLALSRVAQRVSVGVIDRFRSGTHRFTAGDAEPLHHDHHWDDRRELHAHGPLQESGACLFGHGRTGRPRRTCTDYLPVMSGAHICMCLRTLLVAPDDFETSAVAL